MMLIRLSHGARERVRELARYGVVVAFGLGVDIGVGITGRSLFSLPLVVSGAAGFCVGVAINYLLFETWVFKTSQPSWRRLGQAYLAGSAALAVRIATLSALHVIWHSPQPIVDVAKLVVAAGLSLTVNFLLIRRALHSSTKPA